MEAREMILAQINVLNNEKAALLEQFKAAEIENINAVREQAANDAEAQYVEALKQKVDGQFKIAEEQLNALLLNFPEPVVEEQPAVEEQPIIEGQE